MCIINPSKATSFSRPLLSLPVVLVLCAFAAVPVFAQTTQDVVNQVSKSQYQTYQLAVENSGLGLYDLQFNQGYRSRDGWSGEGTSGNQEAREYLSDKFADMGLDVTIQGDYKNVVAELTGIRTPEKIYIIGGHYDTSSDADRPGGDDNASGTAGVLEAARVLSRYSFESTIRFIGFNAEEDGMRGSQNYVDNVAIANNENIAGMINLDMILRPGWDSDASQPEDLDIGTPDITSCINWANIFIAAAQTYAPSLSIDSSTPFTVNWSSSDHGPFANAGYPAIMLIENTVSEIQGSASNTYYHTFEDASDRLANNPLSPSGVVYNYDFATDVVRAAVVVLAEEAQLVPEPAMLLLLGLGALMLRKKR